MDSINPLLDALAHAKPVSDTARNRDRNQIATLIEAQIDIPVETPYLLQIGLNVADGFL